MVVGSTDFLPMVFTKYFEMISFLARIIQHSNGVAL